MRANKLRFALIPFAALMLAAAVPTVASAQRRGPVGHRLVVRGGLYGPIFFDPFYSYGYGFGYGYPSYQFGYPYPPYGYYGRVDDLTASIRLEVTPKNTEVFVDGYRAGTVDDFDGFFQRLRMRPGEHDLTLYLDGHRSVHQHLYLNSGADQKVRYTMVPLAAGESQEARPQAPPPPQMNADDQPPSPPAGMPMGRRGGPPPQGPGRFGPPRGAGPADNSTFGSVSIRVQPADADVLIDGEKWSTSSNGDRLVVQLSEGRHHVDVQKDGYEKYSSDVTVRRGETINVNVSLLRRAN